MESPIAKTHPAELKVAGADPTCHVVAPLVLFNWPLAFGAGFGVCHDPSQILRLSIRFLVPLVHYVAVAGRMFLSAAGEASFIATLAHDCGLGGVLLSLEAVLTAFVAAPLERFIFLSERPAQIIPVEN